MINISQNSNSEQKEEMARRITQHKRFVPYGTHPNFGFAETSFMLGTLDEIAAKKIIVEIR